MSTSPLSLAPIADAGVDRDDVDMVDGELVERGSGGRGALLGITLGAGMWAGILMMFGVIKL